MTTPERWFDHERARSHRRMARSLDRIRHRVTGAPGARASWLGSLAVSAAVVGLLGRFRPVRAAAAAAGAVTRSCVRLGLVSWIRGTLLSAIRT